MNNHVHIAFIHLLVFALMYILVSSLINWFALKYKDNSNFWASFANLHGLE